MDIPSTSDLEPKSFADLSIFDGIGNNFKKHLDAHLAQANLDDKTDSLFMESVVIHNEINLEDELVKAKDEDEGAFRLLSMSFYDKKTRNSSSKTHAKSPPRTEEPNKVFTLRPNKPRSPKSPSAPGKTGSQPSITPFASEINANQIKDNRLGSPKMSVKPEIKLFSIKERVGKLNMSPQLSPVPQMSFTTAASPLEKSKSQTIPKEGAKQERERERDREKEGVRPQKPTSPLRESISRESSAEKKLNTLDLKISTMIKSKSPTNGVKSSSKERIFASPPRVTFSVSPKGFKFHSKLEGSVEKVKMTREPSEPNEKKLSISTKNEKSEKGERGEKEESPARNLSPKTFSLNKNILARRFDLQRVSLNNVNYTLAKESQVKESRTPSKTIQKTTSELANQQASQAQGQNLAQPVKMELAKGYRSNQSFYSKNASRRGSNNEQVKNSKLFGTKLRINTEENSSLKISVKDISDTSIQPQGSRSVKAKMIGLDFSSIRQREGVTFSSGKDVFEPPKLSLKSQKSKSKLKETIGRELDISKRKSSVLPLQCRTFDI